MGRALGAGQMKKDEGDLIALRMTKGRNQFPYVYYKAEEERLATCHKLGKNHEIFSSLISIRTHSRSKKPLSCFLRCMGLMASSCSLNDRNSTPAFGFGLPFTWITEDVQGLTRYISKFCKGCRI